MISAETKAATAKVKAIIPLDDFRTILAAALADEDCKIAGCGTYIIDCRLRMCREALREWWAKTNGESAPGFVHYEKLINRIYRGHITRREFPEDNIRVGFLSGSSMMTCDKMYPLITAILRESFLEDQQKRVAT